VLKGLARRIVPALFTLMLIGLGCDKGPVEPELTPTGDKPCLETGSLTGSVTVTGISGSLPYTRVYAILDEDTLCTSAFTAIQVVGNHTSPAFSVTASRVMDRLGGCVWADSLNLVPSQFDATPGRLQWKFITNRTFDNPPDYGSPGSGLGSLVGISRLGAPGPDGNIEARVITGGPYLAMLDESSKRYAILPWSQAPVRGIDQSSGQFEFNDLCVGNYTLVFRGAGVEPMSARGLVVAADDTTTAGNTILRPAAGVCQSQYTNIQVAGDLNPEAYGNFDLVRAPQMTMVEGCIWEATVNVATAGNHFFKFITDLNFDETPDYGGSEVCTADLEGSVSLVTGTGTALCIEFPSAGDFLFRLDETTLTYEITRGSGSGPTGRLKGRIRLSDNPDPMPETLVQVFRAGTNIQVDSLSVLEAFSFGGLPVGSYDVQATASGYIDEVRTVIVIENQTTDLGTITLDPGCQSVFTRIQVVGNLNTDLYGNFEPARSPDLVNLGNCVWQGTVNSVQAGNRLFKFVTGGAFGADDYGSDEICRAELTGPVAFVDGPGTAICITFAESGNYRFTLDEKTLSYAIERIQVAQPATIRGSITFNGAPGTGQKAFVQLVDVAGPIPITIDSDSTTAAFEFTGFGAGIYELRLSATGFVNTTRSAAVLAGQVLDVGAINLVPGFTSRFKQIALIGNFPGINWEPANQRAMVQSPAGTWKTTLTALPGGNYFFKFRTNDNWESPDPDYGSNNDETCRPVLSGPVTLISGGGPNALCVTFPAGTADYEFTLDEVLRTYAIVRQGEQGTGRLVGSITFAGIAGAPIPSARIRLQTQAGTADLGQAASDPLTGAWTLDQLDAGTYKIIVEAGCFQSVTIENLVVGTATTAVPPVNLAVGTSMFQRIQLLGSFNGFDLGSTPDMSKLSACVWVDTLVITDVTAPIEFKFVTDGDFDTSPDYGVPGDQLDPASGPCVLGAGGSSGNIKIQLAEPGTYFFEIDERFPRYIVSRIGPAEPGTGGSR